MKNALPFAAAVLCLTAAALFARLVFVTVPALEQSQQRAAAAVVRTAGELERTIAAARPVLQAAATLPRLADGRLSAIEREANSQLKELQGTVAANLDRANGTLAQLAEVRADVAQTLAETRLTIAAARVPIETGDRFLKDLRPQALGLVAAAKVTAGETATTMRDFRRVTPEFIAIGRKLGDESAGVAANVNRLTHPHWYDRALGYGLNSAVIYRSLHPETNLNVRGGQFISARP